MDGESRQLGLKLERQSRADFAQLPIQNLHALPRRFARLVLKPCEIRRRLILAILILLLVPVVANGADLKPETLQAWTAYVRAAELRMEGRASGRAPFLWVDEGPGLAERVRAGEILVGPVDGESPRPVPCGLIHDWLGAIFFPNARLDDVMSVLDDYERYPDFYGPMVAKARRTQQAPGHEKVVMVMVHKAYSVTGAVETDNEVTIVRLDAKRAYSLSASVRVREIADYGQPGERTLTEDHGPGFVWRTFSVTRLEQRDDGVYVEMEMAGMSRSIPVLFRWLVQPLAERLPRSILAATLEDTRDAVSQKIRAVSLKTPSITQVVTNRPQGLAM